MTEPYWHYRMRKRYRAAMEFRWAVVLVLGMAGVLWAIERWV